MPFAVSFIENLGTDFVFRVDQHRAGVGHPVPVFNVKLSNRFAVHVRQQRECDLLFFRKLFQYVHLVVADTNQLNSCFFEFLDVVLQLNQMLFAEGSPVRGPVKDQSHGIRFRKLTNRDFVAVLIL
jgi:hypothetical protein